MSPAPETKLCDRCAHPHTGLFRTCEQCMDLSSMETYLEEQEATAQQQRRLARRAQWHTLCPPDYRQTDWTNPRLSPVCADLARHWWPAWESQERGLGILGTSGVGKSRAAYAILARLHFAGFEVLAVDSFRFAAAANGIYERALDERGANRSLLRQCQTTRVLLLDDIGKEKANDSSTAAMHELLEIRNRQRLPLIWTTERTGEELAQCFGSNYADGIIRRLRDASLIANTQDTAFRLRTE